MVFLIFSFMIYNTYDVLFLLLEKYLKKKKSVYDYVFSREIITASGWRIDVLGIHKRENIFLWQVPLQVKQFVVL